MKSLGCLTNRILYAFFRFLYFLVCDQLDDDANNTDPRRNTRNVRTGTVTTARPTRIPTRTRTARIRTRMAASIVKSPPGRIRYVPRPECVRNHFDVDSLKPASVCVCVCVCVRIMHLHCILCSLRRRFAVKESILPDPDWFPPGEEVQIWTLFSAYFSRCSRTTSRRN